MNTSKKETEIFEIFQKQTSSISKQLEKIAEITMTMAKVNIADSSNPDFIAIMKNHKKLTDYMEQLIKDYEAYLKSKD